MGLIVQKYGGTSMAGAERIRNVARRVVDTQKRGHDVVVVVSAMAGVTDQLVAMANEISPSPDPREYDMLVSTGEQQTIALLAMAIQALGARARSFTSAQVKVYTDDDHARARIHRIDTSRIREELAAGGIVVLPGFQGVTDEGDITTLGRGGSDTSAVAFAAALGADVCEIYTDVTGVFTSDPRIVPNARKLAQVSYDEMLEMASLGAKVLQIRSVKFGKQFRVPIHVRSSFSDEEGTWVVPESEIMERLVVSGVTYNRAEAKVTIFGVPDVPGIAAKIFGPLSESGIVVDMTAERVDAGSHRHDVHRRARGHEARACAGRGRRPRPRRGRREIRQRDREGLGRGPGHEGPRGRRGKDVRGAVAPRDQHPDDQHLGDQDLRGDRREIHRARLPCAARRVRDRRPPRGARRGLAWSRACPKPSGRARWSGPASARRRLRGGAGAGHRMVADTNGCHRCSGVPARLPCGVRLGREAAPRWLPAPRPGSRSIGVSARCGWRGWPSASGAAFRFARRLRARAGIGPRPDRDPPCLLWRGGSIC
jgi:aspartate kinase